MNREEWVEKAFQSYKKEQRVYKITNELTNAGFDKEEANSIVNEVIARMQLQRAMARIKRFRYLSFILPALGILILYFGFFILPDWYIRDGEMILSAVISFFGLAAILGGLILGRLSFENTLSEAELNDDKSESWFGYIIFGIIVASVILFAFSSVFMSVKIEKRAEQILFENGIETSGWINDGEAVQYRVKRSTVKEFTLKVDYRMKESKKVVRSLIEVSEGEFYNVYQGQKVRVIYSGLDPTHAKIIDYNPQ